MVATDCLSEGVNLQSHFSAVIHYDLPWNPNRLEQREGRIDRYGQNASLVKSCLLYGQDNPVDGAVLEVLIRKAVQIHKTLGITVPVPMDSNTVSEAVFKSLFDRATDAVQLSLLDLLDEGESAVEQVHQNWDKAVQREKLNRTRFAQRSIKPAEVEQELIESDQILGSEQDVERFESQRQQLHPNLKNQYLLVSSMSAHHNMPTGHYYLFDVVRRASLKVLGAACNANTLRKTAAVMLADIAGGGILRWMGWEDSQAFGYTWIPREVIYPQPPKNPQEPNSPITEECIDFPSSIVNEGIKSEN